MRLSSRKLVALASVGIMVLVITECVWFSLTYLMWSMRCPQIHPSLFKLDAPKQVESGVIVRDFEDAAKPEVKDGHLPEEVFLVKQAVDVKQEVPEPEADPKPVEIKVQEKPAAVKPKKSKKLILAYTTIYGLEFGLQLFRTYTEIRALQNPLGKCEYKCEWSTDRSDYNRSDAVIFHMYNMSPEFKGYREFVIKDLPARHSPDQKWVLMVREPNSFFYPDQLRRLNSMFNLTMTFQYDSDIRIPYGKYWKMSEAARIFKSKKKMDYFSGKYKMVAWLASNCVTSSRREDYVRELQNYIPIDIYGKCGKLKASSEGDGTIFRRILAKQYKFYIAFENSDCDDYITEKFWNSLSLGLIPIVRGNRNNYEKLAPPNSYIHADSFPSPRHLARHLKRVAYNVTLFHEYHQWRRIYDAEFKLITANTDWRCDLCKQVHTSPRKTVDVYNHFSERTRCKVYRKDDNRTGEHMEDIVNYVPL